MKLDELDQVDGIDVGVIIVVVVMVVMFVGNCIATTRASESWRDQHWHRQYLEFLARELPQSLIPTNAFTKPLRVSLLTTIDIKREIPHFN